MEWLNSTFEDTYEPFTVLVVETQISGAKFCPQSLTIWPSRILEKSRRNPNPLAHVPSNIFEPFKTGN